MIDDISPPGSWVRELSARPHTYRDVWAALREAEARLAKVEAERDALQQVIDAWLPKHKCDGCGKELNMHLLIPEEGDRWECEPCNRRLDAAEFAAREAT